MSIYLLDSVGMNPSNILVCEQAALVLRSVRGPWICSGDWNLEPDVLAASGFLKLVDGVVFAASLPTCGQKSYDSFVVSKSIAHAVVGAQRIEGVGIEPHYPARLLIRGDARRFATRKLVRPARVPPVLPHGPQTRPPDYESVHQNLEHVPTRLQDGGPDIEVQSFLDKAMRAWYQSARTEFSTISSEDLSPRFVVTCAAKATASQWSGTTAVSSSWRVSQGRVSPAGGRSTADTLVRRAGRCAGGLCDRAGLRALQQLPSGRRPHEPPEQAGRWTTLGYRVRLVARCGPSRRHRRFAIEFHAPGRAHDSRRTAPGAKLGHGALGDSGTPGVVLIHSI